LLELETIREAPKALLHDHLDGGLRPETVLELAAEVGYGELPTSDPAELARWFTRGADRKSLELYLEGFDHTIALLQTRDALERVAAECAEDLAADNVVYAEVRYAPELSTEGGLTLDEVVMAILDGFREGEHRARTQGRRITMKLLVSAMRQAARSVEAAELAVRHRDEGVVGFDIAGPEAGFPPTRHLDAFQLIQRENFQVTIHAGDRRVPLEMCPTCNVQTGAAASIEEHPIDLLRRLRYRVTVNTDNRLMSGVTLSSEFHALARAFGIGLDDMEWLTTNAMKSAFAPFDERLELINEAIKPGYAKLRDREPNPLYTR